MKSQYDNMVQWHWGGSFPTYWQLEISSDNTPSWSTYALLSGDSNVSPIWIHYDELGDGSDNTYFRVIGVPYSGAPSNLSKTNYSNTIVSSKPSTSGETPTLTQLDATNVSFAYGSGMLTGYCKYDGGAWLPTYDGQIFVGVQGHEFQGYCSAPGYADSPIASLILLDTTQPPAPPTFVDLGRDSGTRESYRFVFGAGSVSGFYSISGASWTSIANNGTISVNNNDTLYGYCTNSGGASDVNSVFNITIVPDPTFNDHNDGNVDILFSYPATRVDYYTSIDATVRRVSSSPTALSILSPGDVIYAYSSAPGFRNSSGIAYSVH